MEFALLGLVVLLATGLRVYYVGAYADDGRGPERLRVQEAAGEDFTALVRALNQGRGFVRNNGERRADVAPLYPWLVSQLAATPDDVAVLMQRTRWLQCALGGLTAGLLFLFARQAFQSLPVALLAGVFAAVYPFWVAATAEIADGVLASFLLALSLYLAARSRFQEFAASWLFGLTLAGLAHTRAALLPYALVSLLGFLHACRSSPGRTVPALLALFGFASGMAPWSLRNYEAFHRVIPVVDSTYYHLWVGNHGEGASEAPASEREQAEAVRETIHSDPAGFVQRRLWAASAFMLGENWLTKQRLFEEVQSAPAEDRLFPTFRVFLPASLLVLLTLAALGWRWTYANRQAMLPAALAVIVVPLPYILGHAEALSGPRLPLDGVFICLAAYAVIWMIAGLRGLRVKEL
jgi:hypothetical protein